MKAVRFTLYEGGDWYYWEKGNIKDSILKKRHPLSIKTKGIEVHALDLSNGREWDCVNGFRN